MELYLTYVLILLKIVGLNGQLAGPIRRNPGPQQQQITTAANFAVNTLNQQNRQRGGARWFTLTTIQNSNSQSRNGLVHTMDIILTESMCTNTNNYQGATQAQCPPYTGGAVMRCSVTVWQQSMSSNLRLQNSNCSPVNPVSNQIGTAQTGNAGNNAVNNQQTSSSASTNPPQQLRDAANFATNLLNSQNRQQARTRRWYTLMDVRNPRQQTNNNMVYNMDILLSESSCPNTAVYINASPSRCPPLPGSESQLCSVVVTYNPTRMGYQLTNYNCQKYQQQQNAQASLPSTNQPSTITVNVKNMRPNMGSNQQQGTPTQVATQSGQQNGQVGTNQQNQRTITVNVKNLPNVGTNQQQGTPNQIATQTGQQNLRPAGNQPSTGASQNLFQPQQPIRVAPSNTGTRVGANVLVNPALSTGPNTRLNVGNVNPSGRVNLGGIGPQGPQIISARNLNGQNINSGVNMVRPNSLGSINLNGQNLNPGVNMVRPNGKNSPGSSINLGGQNLNIGVNNVRPNSPGSSINLSGQNLNPGVNNVRPNSPGSSINLSGQNLNPGVNNVRPNGPGSSINLSGQNLNPGVNSVRPNGPGSSINLSGQNLNPGFNSVRPNGPGSSINLNGQNLNPGVNSVRPNGPVSSINLNGQNLNLGGNIIRPNNPGSSINLNGQILNPGVNNIRPNGPGSSINLSGQNLNPGVNNIRPNNPGSSINLSGQNLNPGVNNIRPNGPGSSINLNGQNLNPGVNNVRPNGPGSSINLSGQNLNQGINSVRPNGPGSSINFSGQNLNSGVTGVRQNGQNSPGSSINLGGQNLNLGVNNVRPNGPGNSINLGGQNLNLGVNNVRPNGPGSSINLSGQNLNPGVNSLGSSINLSGQNLNLGVNSVGPNGPGSSINLSGQNLNPGIINSGSSINLSGSGSRLPQTNGQQNFNTGITNSGSSINLSGQNLASTNVIQNGQTSNTGAPLQQSNQIDSQVTAAANFATNAYNAQIRQQFSTEDKWYSLIDISNVQRQGNGGSIINMDINLHESTCLKTVASTRATLNNCPPLPGGKASLCSVSVLYDSMRQQFRLLRSTCRDPRPQQMRTGSTVSTSTTSQQNSAATQITGAAGGIPPNSESSQIRRAATTATNKINVQSRQNANDNKWYTLVEIQDPQVQNVGGSFIDMNLVLSQSQCLNVDANIGASSSSCPEIPGGLKKICPVKLWHESFNIEDKLLSSSCQPLQTSVMQGSTVQQQNQQQTQQRSMSTSGLQPAETASSIIIGGVLNDPVQSSSSRVTSPNVVTSGGSPVGQIGTGFSPTASLTSTGAATGPSAPTAALTQAGATNNIAILPNGMSNVGSTAQISNNLNQGSVVNTNLATSQINSQGATSTGANQGGINGASAGSSLGSPRVIDVANFATNEVNTRNRPTNQSWFTLVDIINATRQELVSGGWVYKMEIVTAESTCQNINTNFDANNVQCPELNGGRVRRCQIEVVDQPNVPGLQIEVLDCMVDTQTQTGPTNVLPNTPLQQQVPAATNTGVPQVNPNTPEMQDVARFATQEINMQIRQEPNIIDPKWFTLANVRNAQQMFLGGMVYSMDIDLVESTCQNIDQYVNATTTQCPPQNRASTKTCYIEVERVPRLLSYKLKTQHCSTQAFSTNAALFTKPQSPALGTQSQEIKAAANFAVNRINEQSSTPNTNRFVLVDIQNPQEKSFSGWEYAMNLVLQESTCPNTPAYKDATEQQCPPRTGGLLRICEVKVLHQPWTFGYRLENSHCLNQ